MLMSKMHLLFPTPVLQVPATIENYDPVQIEIRDAWQQIQETGDYSTVTYLYNGSNEAITNKTYNFIEKYNCVNLEARIYDAVYQYLNQVGWQGECSGFKIRDSWLNIMDVGVSHGHHNHPGYALSGTYYFRVNAEQGAIKFSNPNILMFHCQFPQGNLCPQTLDIVPDDGDIVLFPSWLVHATNKNASTEQRISVAFNLDPVDLDESKKLGLVKRSHVPINKVEMSIRLPAR